MQGVLTTCDFCGKEFYIYHKARLNAKHHTCSAECMGKLNSMLHTSNKYKCVNCGTTIIRKPSDVVDAPCCSMACRGEYIRKSGIYNGEKNPNYNNRGDKNPIWKSDRKVSPYGYYLIRVPDHPFANCDGFVFEHRLVAEENLLTEENSVLIDGKRYLRQDYDVHHKDRDKKNNAVENLLVLSRSDHMKLHWQLKKLASQNPEKSVKSKSEEAHDNTETQSDHDGL